MFGITIAYFETNKLVGLLNFLVLEEKISGKNIKISDLLVLNIDSDHLDFFGDFENYKYAFYNVMNNVIDNLVLNNDDKNLKGFKSQKQTATYGKTKNADFYIKTKDSFIHNKTKYKRATRYTMKQISTSNK